MVENVDVVRRMEMDLGEGPLWIADRNELAFVDIKGKAVHRLRAADGGLQTLKLPVCPTFVFETDDDGLIIGAESGIYRLNADGLGAKIVDIPQPSTNRTNDATVDAHGQLWFGTMDDNETDATGTIWCFAKGSLRRTGVQAVITNGPAISADGRTLYFADSIERTIWRCDIGEDGSLSAPQIFTIIAESDGYPDGVVVDSAGCVWVGLWDGWAARCYSPDGTLVKNIRMPCARVTKVAFGGPDLKTAYVTTARTGLTEQELTAQPLAGSLFSFRADAPGLVIQPVSLASPS